MNFKSETKLIHFVGKTLPVISVELVALHFLKYPPVLMCFRIAVENELAKKS